MKNELLFDLDIKKKMEAPTEIEGQTATITKTITKVSKVACKTFTCICTASCSNCK